MIVALFALAVAAAVESPDPAAQVFLPFAELGSPLPPPERAWGVAPPVTGGGRLLDVYRAGNLAILHDADGEWLSEATSYVLDGDLNWVLESMSSAFYRHFGDDYQYLNVMLVRDLGFFFAFYQPLANDVTGIGYDNVAGLDTFDGTSNSLEGFLFMNAYSMWYDDPVSGRYVFDQEFMHRWGAFVDVSHPDLAAEALRGRDSAHWSYWLHTPNSPMEGNTWEDLGNGIWSVDYDAASTYSDLDLYLMGLLGPEDVGDSTFLVVSEEEQESVNRNPASTPEYLVEATSGTGQPVHVAGSPVTVTIDDIIAAEGPRVPSVEDSPRTFRMAYLVLVLSDDVLDEATLAALDSVRVMNEADWEEDVRGLADLDTTLGDGDAPNWGEAPADDPRDTGDTGFPGGTDSSPVVDDPEGADDDRLEVEGQGCGCATPGGASAPGFAGLLLGALAARRRR